MARLHIILIILMLAPLASACRTGFDYCLNATLPNDDPGDVSGADDLRIYFYTGIFDEKNIEDQSYVYQNLSNVYIEVHNSTDPAGAHYTWNVGSDSGSEPFGIELYRQGCQDGCANTTAPYISLCINGTQPYIDRTGIVFTGVKPQRNYGLSDFTSYYRRNWTFLHEENESTIDFRNRDATLTVWCNDYTEFDINLTDESGNGNSVTVQSIEEPKYFLKVDGQAPRVRQDTDHYLKDNFYFASELGDKYTFTLIDYTGGQFYMSTLAIEKDTGSGFDKLHVEQFEQDNIVKVYLLNATQYKVKLTGEKSTRNLGGIYVTNDDLDRDIVVSRPDFNKFAYRWDGLEMAFTKDYDNSQLGCNINSTPATTGYFNVFNVTDDDYVIDHHGSAIGYDMSLTYVVGDRDATYFVECMTNDSEYGLRKRSELIFMRNESGIYEGFDLNLPAEIIGVSRAFFYRIIALSIILLMFGLFSAVTYGTGGLAGSISMVFFDYIGYFPVPSTLLGLLVFLSIFMKLSEGRSGVST